MFRLLQKIVFLAVLVFFFINTFNFAYDGTILNLEIDGQSTTYHLTASSNGYIFAQWRLWPKYIENVTQQPVPQPANISILVSFCSACGEFQFGYRKNIPVSIDTQYMDQKVSYDNTGTVVNPLNFEMVIEYLNPQNETYYFAFVALSQKTATCALTVSAVNKTAAASRPSPPIPGQNGLINATRKGRDIVVTFALAQDLTYPNDVLQYRPFVSYLRDSNLYDRRFCDIFVGEFDWQNNTNSFTITPKFLSSDVLVTVKVRNPRTGLIADYQRAYVPFSQSYNIIRLIGTILLGLMIVIPISILYSGYHRSFGLRFLVFQYLTQTEEENPSDSSTSNDRMMRKASHHTFILLTSQIVCQIVLIAVATAWETYLTLNFIIAVFTLPLLLFGLASTFSKKASYILGYIVGALWFFSLQCTVMLYNMHVGSDTIYKTNQIEAEAPFIISQVIVTVNAVLVIISLSPTSFLFHKLNSTHPEGYADKLTKKQRVVVSLCIANIAVTIVWLDFLLYVLPTTEWKLVTSGIIHLFILIHLNLSFALLTLFAAFASLYNSETFNKVNIFILVFGIFYALVSTVFDMFFYAEVGTKSLFFITTLRLIGSGLQIGILVLSVQIYIEKTGERIPHLVSKFCSPRRYFATLGILAALLFIATLWKSVLELILIIFHIEGTFPPLYLLGYLFLLGNPTTFVAAYFDAPLLYVISIMMNIIPFITLSAVLTLATMNIPIFIISLIYFVLMGISSIAQCVKKSVKEENQIELTESQSQRTLGEPTTSESFSQAVPKESDESASGIKLEEEENAE